MDPLRYLAAPQPFKAITEASSKEIKARIAFVDSLLAHPRLDVSESQHEEFVMYREACEILAEGESSEDNQQTLQQGATALEAKLVPQTDGATDVNLSFDLATKTKMGEEVDNLWNMWSFVRYEKYLPAQAMKGDDETKREASQAGDPWHRAFWKPFQGRLEAESEAFARVLKGENAHNECPTYLLLALLTERHTLDWDETLALIKACAGSEEGETVEMPGADIVELIRARDTTALAKRLDHDEASISLSAEYVMGVPAMVLAFFGTHLPEALFDTDDFDSAQWKPKQRLEDLLQMTEGQEEAVKALMSEMYDAMLEDDSSDDFEDEEWVDDEDGEDDLLDETAFSDGSEEDY
ncbi:hypothetical protein P170DRAFT_441803 [Aspergillus steynii IBT 23096]|uniref:Uncharacterized protein n=1 Tax=Aspergillus steynii IBT 23096 TaxID=1392250 RepID=A0A2I2FRZ2_9EURO|nr:uncharacterized protein P170DRAFT_441803 [Aspergillus steynii IBT 23096]PLB43402.1 hypothetical protein P170DRAFT_441803 [Aspergillus steynii IBT 23096]